jgi:hypothetical protein
MNHDELFPGHVSTLKVSDPELIEYFDNFAFDEVLRYGNLDRRTRLHDQGPSPSGFTHCSTSQPPALWINPPGNGRRPCARSQAMHSSMPTGSH